MYENLGKHMVLDVHGCDVEKLNSLDFIKELFDKIVDQTGLNVLNRFFYKFEPQGVTAAYVLSESHLTVHTFPEVKQGSAAFCLYTCGSFDKFKVVEELISISLNVQEKRCVIFDRGESL